MNDDEKKVIQSRVKSKVVWLAALAQVVLIVVLVSPDVANYIKIVGTSVIEILTVFGILNDPTNKGGF